MHSLSLLSYSISYSNPSRGHHSSSSSPSELASSGPTIVLPPIHNAHKWTKPRQQVLHPKISTVLRPPCHLSVSKTPPSLLTEPSWSDFSSTHTPTQIKSHPCTQPLTEHNLFVSNNAPPNYATGIPSPPKSVLLVGLMLPALLPSLAKAELHGMDSYRGVEGGKKRRQRLGPSCDQCRQRKVKCDAEISIVLTVVEEFAGHCKQLQLQESTEALLWAGNSVEIETGTQLVIHNEKLVKFRLCKLCEVKQLACCFLKGFTKDDIVSLSKKNNINNDNKVTKPVIGGGLNKVERGRSVGKKPVKFDPSLNRKSSCSLCRQRKVKCLYSESLGRCENCHRKNKSCLFDC